MKNLKHLSTQKIREIENLFKLEKPFLILRSITIKMTLNTVI